jgi:hypothetical protein
VHAAARFQMHDPFGRVNARCAHTKRVSIRCPSDEGGIQISRTRSSALIFQDERCGVRSECQSSDARFVTYGAPLKPYCFIFRQSVTTLIFKASAVSRRLP